MTNLLSWLARVRVIGLKEGCVGYRLLLQVD
jgi:hypothetical protein